MTRNLLFLKVRSDRYTSCILAPDPRHLLLVPRRYFLRELLPLPDKVRDDNEDQVDNAYLDLVCPSVQSDVNNIFALIEMYMQFAASSKSHHSVRTSQLIPVALLEEFEVKRPTR